MAYGRDKNSYLNACFRFTSRRGITVKMNSDNGTNFVGANKELKELLVCLDTNQIMRKTANKRVQWEFNHPNALHLDGVHEIMIKTGKRTINRILKHADNTDEELNTAFIGAEGFINSRPLTFKTTNPRDDVGLTPNHFDLWSSNR